MALFESFHDLDRSWDERELEHQSLRSVFSLLLVMMFLLGVIVFMVVYRAVHLHRFEWSQILALAAIAIPCFRSARIIYRRLGA